VLAGSDVEILPASLSDALWMTRACHLNLVMILTGARTWGPQPAMSYEGRSGTNHLQGN
jgi:hypothetical protein